MRVLLLAALTLQLIYCYYNNYTGNIEVGYAADMVFVDPAILEIDCADVLYNCTPFGVMVGGSLSTLAVEGDSASSSRRPFFIKGRPEAAPLPPPPLQSLNGGAFIPGKAGGGNSHPRRGTQGPICACALRGNFLCSLSKSTTISEEVAGSLM